MMAVFVDSTGVITWAQQPDMQATTSHTDADLPLFMLSNVKAVYPPCPDAQASRRFVRGAGAWRIHCR